jgi:hypothetical protein
MEFEMARASTSAIATLMVISGLLIATTIPLLMFTWSASHGSVRIDERNLQIRLPFYGRTKTPEVALAKLRASKAS